ncbi:MAG: efflux RND transporter periplasmic adaptor subunit [Marinicaulis sp.]|nr:efflux RND transporter periplasmic adaptor subunit [Marinicaulis sp.]
MFRKFFTLIGTVGILVGGFGLIGLLGQMRPDVETSEPQIIAPVVFYDIAESTPVTLDVQAQGEVRPRTDINLTAQVAGQVISISDAFVDGGAFEKGDILVKIEDAPYRATAAAARARLAQEEAEAALARTDYEDLGRDEDPAALALRLPQLEQARAEYRAAQINLNRTTIRAPFEGRVRQRIAGVGQYVAPGAQLGRIFSTDVAEIRLPLTDDDLAKLGLPIAFSESEDRPGPPVKLSAIIAGESYEWTGRIARTDGAIDPTTRQVFAITVVDDPYGDAAVDGAPLAMGLFVDATIEGKPFPNAIILPRSALHGRDTVFVVKAGNILKQQKVQIVSTDRDTITIAGGISPGDRVVTSPLRGANDGDEVSPEPSNPSTLNLTSVKPTTYAEVTETKDEAAPEIEPVESDETLAMTERSEESTTAKAVADEPNASILEPEIIVTESDTANTNKFSKTDVVTDAGPEIVTASANREDETRRYRPGDRAPHDEVADDLNAQQLGIAPNQKNVEAADGKIAAIETGE